MKRYEGKLAGILGTIIVHLLAAIVFVFVQLNSLERDMAKEIVLFFEEPEQEINLEPIKLPDLNAARLSDIDIRIRNIVRNLADKEDPVIDPEEYQDRVKEEMLRAGTLKEKNFIDEWKNKSTEENNIKVEVDKKDSLNQAEDKSKNINYQGLTRVYYNLEGREHRRLPIPVYKCQGEGKVTVSIDVDNEGTVLAARIVSSESSTSDICLLETAVQSAIASSFNPSPASPKKQTGTITFHFVAQ